jgi:phosphonate transport system substrate-binding protein
MRRRSLIAGAMAGSAVLSSPSILQARSLFRLALTPVFLDNDALVIEQLRLALSEGMGRDIELVQRRTYQEITGAILDGSVDAAWVCGYPYVQYRKQLQLLGVPIWRGRPLYQSYLIVGADDPATSLADLRGDVHAFSDPNSNSGYLVTASDLARMGESPDEFFQRSIFTYGHRNVVRAVSAGLTRSGSVDGYVWEVLAQVDPELTEGTKVIVKSEWLGFPPFAASHSAYSFYLHFSICSLEGPTVSCRLGLFTRLWAARSKAPARRIASHRRPGQRPGFSCPGAPPDVA